MRFLLKKCSSHLNYKGRVMEPLYSMQLNAI